MSQMMYDRVFARDVHRGLLRRNRAISSKYFYDAQGSQLFNEITGLREYYLTRIEKAILREQSADILRKISVGAGRLNFSELGPGDGSKAAIILERAVRLFPETTYSPVDISGSALADAIGSVSDLLPQISISGIETDFFRSIPQFHAKPDEVLLTAFLGSSLGNLTRLAGKRFLKSLMMAHPAGSYFLLGLDCDKDPVVLHEAYSDPSGITAAFNLNLLTRINSDLQADIPVGSFFHHAEYNETERAMHSYLVAREDISFRIGATGHTYRMQKGDRIFTERSTKYTETDALDIACYSGASLIKIYSDSANYYMLLLLQTADK